MVLGVKNLPANAGVAGAMALIPESGRFPQSRKWQAIPLFLHGQFCGPRSLSGYIPWGHNESDKTE